jgi:transposase-like protein
MQLYRIVDRLGESCKSPVQVAKELHPRWSGMLGLDTKVVKVRGEEMYLLIAVDIVTQDTVDYWLATQENLITLELFLKELRDEIGYSPKLAVIDLDQTWREAVETVFPYVPIHSSA